MSIFDLRQLRDEDVRPALFDALVARLDAQVQADPTITVVNRMPTVFGVSRRGTLLTLSQGLGQSLLRADLRWKDRLEKPRYFNVVPATLSKLAIMPDRVVGTPDEIADRIVAMFLAWTAAGEDAQPENDKRDPRERPSTTTGNPTKAETTKVSLGIGGKPPVLADRVAKKAPESSQVEALRASTEGTTTSAGVAGDRDRSKPGGERHPASGAGNRSRRADDGPPPSEVSPEPSTPTRRTYEVLLETAQRELDQAGELPVSSNYRLLSAGVFVALTAEAFLNDLGARVVPSWSALQRLDPREKAEVLSIELFNDNVAWGGRPFRSVAEAFGFRRALAHAHSETLPFGRLRSVEGAESEVPRTRDTDWFRYCNVATIQRWIADVRVVIAAFSRANDPT